MKRFKAGINRYYQALLVEIKGGLTKTPLHILKTVVIFFIPFFYAFTYLWAFYDPISKTRDLDLTIVTSRDDALGEFVKGKAEGDEGIVIQNGPNVKITANLNQVYDDQVDGTIDSTNKIVKDSLLTIHVPAMDQRIVETVRDAVTSWEKAKAGGASDTYLKSLAGTLATFFAGNTFGGKATIDYNFKKNFLIGFATDISSAQSGGLNAVINMMVDALTNPKNTVIQNMITGSVAATGVVSGDLVMDGKVVERHLAHHQWAMSGQDPAHPAVSTKQLGEFLTAMGVNFAPSSTLIHRTSQVTLADGKTKLSVMLPTHIEAIKAITSPDGGLIKNAPGTSTEASKAIEVVRLHSQLGTDGHEDFGIGLSPFFISIGMWFGAVAMTVLIHRKIYDRNTYVKWRYMAKGTLINIGVIIQACVLMISLKFIGLDAIGNNHWAIMFGTAIFAGIVFANFIMAIRLSIPSRALSIYIVVIFMVLNIVCSGGLFPVQTQNSFVRAMNTWLPMHFSVEMLRQGLVDTDWATWGAAFGYLSIYLLFVPIGMGFNLIYTHRWYLRYEYKMPKHMQDYHDWWLKTNMERRHGIMKRLKKAGRKQKRGGEV